MTTSATAVGWFCRPRRTTIATVAITAIAVTPATSATNNVDELVVVAAATLGAVAATSLIFLSLGGLYAPLHLDELPLELDTEDEDDGSSGALYPDVWPVTVTVGEHPQYEIVGVVPSSASPADEKTTWSTGDSGLYSNVMVWTH